ncbi:MAG: hypothetical protein K8F35_13150 [Dokdonella sp.]|uniref:hypothetical protein n=1 Tax=Dokdonella sp. TaxID=2291710 RepID=UPI0025BCDED6|nr:hypothetical protein [Dokdonella sp.]MBZ0223965.1 hypothetical protein [Dokdonella sp.]
MRTSLLPTRPLGIALLLVAAPVAATDFCVQNDSQFASALTLSEILPGPNRILLGAGKTFQIAGTRLDANGFDAFNPSGAFTIKGGHNTDCSANATQDAAASVLDGSGAGTGLNYLDVNAGEFSISTLTLTHLPKPLNIKGGGDHVRLRWQHVRTIDSACVRFQFYDGDDRVARIENSLFAHIAGDSDLCTSALYIADLADDSDALQLSLVNNTVSANTRAGATLYAPTAISHLSNNILYGNSSGFVDLDNTDAPTIAIDNIVGTHAGEYFTGSTGNSNANPLFVSATDFSLKTTSPARESGTSAVPYGLSAHDIEGGDRVVGSVVDRGAYEADSSGAAVLLVTNVNDSGAGSLRAAIADANANPAFNIIGFSVPGACPRTIALNSDLPAITDGVSIRGYTQPGSSPNRNSLGNNATICVELIEAAGHAVANGLHFTPAADDDSMDVSGLAIGGFNTGIYIDKNSTGSGSNYSIRGNFIGLAANGSTSRPNSSAGISVRGRVYGTIGGDAAEQRNVIAGGLAGVKIAAEQTNYVVNNFVGTSAGGTMARPNVFGVVLMSPLNQVRDNVVSGNTGIGILVTGEDAAMNTIADNRIGLKSFAICAPPPCTPDWALGNGNLGISIVGGAYDTLIQGNSVAYNGSGGSGAGVRIDETGTTGNRVSANSIYDNSGLGIDVGAAGVSGNDNDATTPAGTPNRGINYPVLGQARGGERNGNVNGHLQSTNGIYRIEFYASDAPDEAGNGEGRYYLGSGAVTITNATPTSNGTVDFDLPMGWNRSLVGKAITALAIDQDGNTSEFSGAATYTLEDLIFADGFDPAIP